MNILGNDLVCLILTYLPPVDYASALLASRLFPRLPSTNLQKKRRHLKQQCGPDFVLPSDQHEGTYTVLDNGGEPFTVTFDKSGQVTVTANNIVGMRRGEKPVEVLVLSADQWRGAWIPVRNAAILVETISDITDADPDPDPDRSHYEYLLVAEMTARFRSPTRIARFQAPIGNSAVPYPFGFSRRHIFFLMGRELTYVDRRQFPDFPVEKCPAQFGQHVQQPDAWDEVLWSGRATVHKLPGITVIHRGL